MPLSLAMYSLIRAQILHTKDYFKSDKVSTFNPLLISHFILDTVGVALHDCLPKKPTHFSKEYRTLTRRGKSVCYTILYYRAHSRV